MTPAVRDRIRTMHELARGEDRGESDVNSTHPGPSLTLPEVPGLARRTAEVTEEDLRRGYCAPGAY
jgi:hypothetical protein